MLLKYCGFNMKKFVGLVKVNPFYQGKFIRIKTTTTWCNEVRDN